MFPEDRWILSDHANTLSALSDWNRLWFPIISSLPALSYIHKHTHTHTHTDEGAFIIIIIDLIHSVLWPWEHHDDPSRDLICVSRSNGSFCEKFIFLTDWALSPDLIEWQESDMSHRLETTFIRTKSSEHLNTHTHTHTFIRQGRRWRFRLMLFFWTLIITESWK